MSIFARRSSVCVRTFYIPVITAFVQQLVDSRADVNIKVYKTQTTFRFSQKFHGRELIPSKENQSLLSIGYIMREIVDEDMKPEANLMEKRRVHWSVELEHVQYFIPFNSKSQCWKMRSAKNQLCKLANEMRARNGLHFVQKRLEHLLHKVQRKSMEWDLENGQDVNEGWDELFGLYIPRNGLEDRLEV